VKTHAPTQDMDGLFLSKDVKMDLASNAAMTNLSVHGITNASLRKSAVLTILLFQDLSGVNATLATSNVSQLKIAASCMVLIQYPILIHGTLIVALQVNTT